MSEKINLSRFDSCYGLDRGASKPKEILWYFTKILFFLTAFPFPSQFKCILLRWFGAQVGEGVVIKPRVNIHMPWKLNIADHVWIGEEVFILNFELLTIESNVCVSQRAFLCGGNHDYRMSSFPYRNGPITLKNGSWVGANAFVGPNTLFEEYAILTAGSMASGLLERETIYSGNPAKALKKRVFKSE